ncbi:hypothetical protein [uncultured Kocuria sp.]|uniref:hypothetical protein n=1 Tax=uncultured Kocuria sp. TaxID=259305 RepID=UPI002594F974|nr:hypothetical protein [uncultured Kocuria sp.]MCT1368026.1 hypothetical protein [Rothia sp. p3-SID1597]
MTDQPKPIQKPSVEGAPHRSSAEEKFFNDVDSDNIVSMFFMALNAKPLEEAQKWFHDTSVEDAARLERGEGMERLPVAPQPQVPTMNRSWSWLVWGILAWLIPSLVICVPLALFAGASWIVIALIVVGFLVLGTAVAVLLKARIMFRNGQATMNYMAEAGRHEFGSSREAARVAILDGEDPKEYLETIREILEDSSEDNPSETESDPGQDLRSR